MKNLASICFPILSTTCMKPTLDWLSQLRVFELCGMFMRNTADSRPEILTRTPSAQLFTTLFLLYSASFTWSTERSLMSLSKSTKHLPWLYQMMKKGTNSWHCNSIILEISYLVHVIPYWPFVNVSSYVFT